VAAIAAFLPVRGIMSCKETARDRAAQPGCSSQALRRSRRARKVKDYITFISPGGLRIDLVLRPLHSGWRYFRARDAGIKSFHRVAIRSTDIKVTSDSGQPCSQTG
jgi:hypothetical protein